MAVDGLQKRLFNRHHVRVYDPLVAGHQLKGGLFAALAQLVEQLLTSHHRRIGRVFRVQRALDHVLDGGLGTAVQQHSALLHRFTGLFYRAGRTRGLRKGRYP